MRETIFKASTIRSDPSQCLFEGISIRHHIGHRDTITNTTKRERERVYYDDDGQEEEQQQQEDKKECHTCNDDIILVDHHWYHIYVQQC